MNTQDVKDYFSRHFLGLVKVNSKSPVGETVCSVRADGMMKVDVTDILARSDIKNSVAVRPSQIGAQMKVVGANLFTRGDIVCSSRGFRFAAQLINVNKTKIKRYAPGEVAFHKFSKLKAQARSGTKQIMVLPQERTNRLQWQLKRPRKDGEVILAWFGPIVEDAVAKLALNKRRGTLLIWYNPQSRRFDAKGLYLYRRMNLKENLEWRWV